MTGQKTEKRDPQRTLPYAAQDDRRAAMERLVKRLRERLDGYIRQCVGVPPTLKRLLHALHSRCYDKLISWPSYRTLAEDLGYDVSDDAWASTKRTIIRQVKRLQELGLLWIQQAYRKDGSQSANLFRIRYQALRRIQPGVNQGRPIVAQAKCHRGVVTVSPPGGHSVTGGWSQCHPPVVTVSPLELNGIETESKPTPPKPHADETANGDGGGGKKEIQKTPSPRNIPQAQPANRPQGKRGEWAGVCDRAALEDSEEVKRLRLAAKAKGFVTDDRLDQFRFLAAVYDARNRPPEFVSGHFINRIETGTWDCLTEKGIEYAKNKLFPGPGMRTLNKAEIQQIRTPRKD